MRARPACAQRHRAARDAQAQPAGGLGALAGQHRCRRRAPLAEGRDLRLVEHVAHVDAVGRDAHDGEVVGREVPERVCARGAGGAEQHAEDQAGGRDRAREPAARAHRSSSSALRAAAHPQRAESAGTPCGPGQPAPRERRPAAPPARPCRAWKTKPASVEPSRSALRAQRRPSAGRPARVSAQPSASAERTLGAAAHARRASSRPRRELPWSASKSASSTSLLTPARSEQPALDVDELERAPAGRRPAGGELGLAQRDDVLGQRQALDDAAQAPDGGAQAGPGPRPREPAPTCAGT